jgi:hypothetical protein
MGATIVAPSAIGDLLKVAIPMAWVANVLDVLRLVVLTISVDVVRNSVWGLTRDAWFAPQLLGCLRANSHLNSSFRIGILEHGDDFIKFSNGRGKFEDSICGQFFWFGQFGGVFEGFIP